MRSRTGNVRPKGKEHGGARAAHDQHHKWRSTIPPALKQTCYTAQADPDEQNANNNNNTKTYSRHLHKTRTTEQHIWDVALALNKSRLSGSHTAPMATQHQRRHTAVHSHLHLARPLLPQSRRRIRHTRLHKLYDRPRRWPNLTPSHISHPR